MVISVVHALGDFFMQHLSWEILFPHTIFQGDNSMTVPCKFQ